MQTGFGRTGKLFAVEHSGVVPDILIAAKSHRGRPAARRRSPAAPRSWTRPGPGGLGGTFGGNPVALAAAHAVLDQMETGALFARAEAHRRAPSRRERRAGRSASRSWATCGAWAPCGPSSWSRTARRRRRPRTRPPPCAKRCYERGLVTITAGTYGNVIRTLMPLVISDEELREGLDVLEAALAAA